MERSGSCCLVAVVARSKAIGACKAGWRAERRSLISVGQSAQQEGANGKEDSQLTSAGYRVATEVVNLFDHKVSLFRELNQHPSGDLLSWRLRCITPSPHPQTGGRLQSFAPIPNSVFRYFRSKTRLARVEQPPGTSIVRAVLRNT